MAQTISGIESYNKIIKKWIRFYEVDEILEI